MAQFYNALKLAMRIICAMSGFVMMANAEALLEGQEIVKDEEVSQALIFDSDFLSIDKKSVEEERHIDLSYFAHKGGMAPGTYVVQVNVNGKLVDEGRKLTFKSWPDRPGKLYACISADELLNWWGVRASSDTTIATASTSDSPCPTGGVTAMVPYAQESFDFNKRLLSLTVPQASLDSATRLRTPPHLWNDGVSALLLNYNYTGNQQNHRGQQVRSDFLGVNGQLNLLEWRVRSDFTGHKRQSQQAEWNFSRAYAQRHFSRFGGGQLTVGNSSSSGGGSESVAFSGIKVDSDDAMLDPSFTAYTPAITGIADTPSTVTARQYGKVIFYQNIPQGPFSLTDFNQSGNGEVEIAVRGMDDRVRRFTLAQASSGLLMRQGAASYSASAGKAINGKGYIDDRFVQVGGSYGVWANSTLTGGALLSQHYQSLALGGGMYAGTWGALNYTLNGSRAALSAIPGHHGNPVGLRYDLGWSRSFGDTSVALSYSRSQTPHAYSYSGLLSTPAHSWNEPQQRETGNRDTLGVSISQSLGDLGSISLSGNRSTFWGSQQVQQYATLSYSTTVRDIGVGIAFSYSTLSRDDRVDEYHGMGRSASWQGGESKTDRSALFTVSLPLGKWLGTERVNNANYSYSRSNGRVSQQTGLNGSAMNGTLSYSVSQELSDNRSGSVNVGYGGNYGSLSAGYSYGDGKSLSYGASGGLALHSHGATLGRSLALNGGNALVKIPDEGGVHVNSSTTDWRGYALISGLTPYDRNQVTVDMTNLPGNIELDTSNKNVVPTRGALVWLPFKSNKGYRLLLSLKHNGVPVPFGAGVTLTQKSPEALPVTGIVSEDGQAYLAGMPISGTVTVNWGEALSEQCTATYALPKKADMARLMTATAECQS
ncbi:fimbrial biogenesis outer membrane usher protein [Pectobacterium parmentieri]|uniref:Fimbrial biogenesis outer membrane usher protein n=4 Tax=Pectobacterium parmentieri TaxID=1905730 RepID=A0ABS0S300_PECPM|nr:fimbria/pilus outer membrane usher protein [Pectobacterium parmentieri]MBI0472096.1 fimbrial biogenesis outer membrane usher protein [Pectobacterium parmentieri]MBI0495871.1 fimbrial biogenesis outer membrane usher protein [Pectobacterium parmentieri]MBI0556257.1 fimbrial biogenesis outer membrane usher protein [Pectobacterium parmentieri]MBI0569341.1 fimbrial biogenesis outer membrane usher protein [Pectobacterium parmentieri]MBI0573943.1 fimbrial biogenesis outer membrane usher protein [P